MSRRMIAIVAAAVLVCICLLVVLERNRTTTYIAFGTFYYWFHGFEMSAGWFEWGGSDPIWCFKRDLWDQRPRDFRWRVWSKFLCRRERDEKQVKPLFKEAYDSVFVAHSGIAFTWGKLYAESRDPVVAADVVDAYMKALSELELKILYERKIDCMEKHAFSYYRQEKLRQKLEDKLSQGKDESTRESARAELETVKGRMTSCEVKINELEHDDIRTNTMFKIMRDAEPPMKVQGFWRKKRIKEMRKWFETLSDPPDL